MVSVGSKALPTRRFIGSDSGGITLMGEGDRSYKKGKRNRERKDEKESAGFDSHGLRHYSLAGTPGGRMKTQKSGAEDKKPIVRKQVDAETVQYFSNIANLFEGKEVEIEERSIICGNALEETRGKELELATDYIISHTLQMLLEGCDGEQLCCFLQSCAKVFPAISMDRSGSHVIESALKSLARHLQDTEIYSLAEFTLTEICEVVVINSVDIMSNCYGSHVLRRLLCLCKGVSLDSTEICGSKSSRVLAGRLNLNIRGSDGNALQNLHQGFKDLFGFLIRGILKCCKKHIKALQVDQYCSLVFQTALKLSVGDDNELLGIISALLDCKMDNINEGTLMELEFAKDILELIKDAAFSRLMEVILEVAPERLYEKLFNKLIQNSFSEISLDLCGNFVIQALVCYTRNTDQMRMIWEELGPRFKDLLEHGKSGVVASVIAASQRLRSHEQKCCQSLAAAVSLSNESPNYVVPRLLFLDSYFACEDKSNWTWPSASKMNIMGSLILQEIFKFSSDLIHMFVNSITAIEAEHIVETAKNSSGARVIEAFLSSSASAKQKRRLIVKLRGHFGELGTHPSGSFTLEKCFDVSNLSLREAIASDLLAVKAELSNTKQGPYLLRKLDIDGYASRPDQWRSRQIAKQSAYSEFHAMFGSGDFKSSKKGDIYSQRQTMADEHTSRKRKKRESNKGAIAPTEMKEKAAKSSRPFLWNSTIAKPGRAKKIRKT